MNKTPIEWVKNPDGTQGYTWNPITGCLNGCEYCYARKLANGRLKSLYLANKNVAIEGIKLYQHEGEVSQDTVIRAHNDPFYPRFWLDRVREEFGACTSGAVPKGIFVCDMSDLFGIGVPEEWTRRILNKIGMSYYREHRFYLLTKQPQNLIKFSPFPDNCWMGVSVTNREMAHNTFNHFQSVEAQVKFLSFEPLLDDVSQYLYFSNLIKSVNWVIIGVQTKPYKPPKVDWVLEIVEACDKAGVPVFLKDKLKLCLGGGLFDSKGKHTPIPFDNPLRQEMPV